MTFDEFKVHLEALVASRSREEVDRAIKAATPDAYYNTLQVSWDYWHLGAHAEHARCHAMPLLGALYRAAWHMDPRVLGASPALRALERDAVRNEALREGQAVLNA
jgi:hypothetical protein